MPRKAVTTLFLIWFLAGCDGEFPSAPKDFGIRVRMVGIVKNAATGAAVAGAQVAVTQSGRTETALSLNDGRYLILSTEFGTGNVAVEVRAPGFNTFTTTVRVVEGSENTLDVVLTPS